MPQTTVSTDLTLLLDGGVYGGDGGGITQVKSRGRPWGDGVVLGVVAQWGAIGQRVQYKVDELMKKRKNRYDIFGPSIKDELDLVEREDQICHEIMLNG